MLRDADLLRELGIASRFAGITINIGELTEQAKRLKREEVLDFLYSRGYQPFTTTDVAEALGVKEYSARATVSWLKLAEYIEATGWHDTREHVRVYRWTGKQAELRTCRRDQGEREMQLAEDQAQRMKSAADSLDSIFLAMRVKVNG